MDWDVIVVGGGHAGLEALWAATRVGARACLVTQKIETIAALSCNPAFGGPAKGGLVREVDALGGLCGKMADLAAIQCRVLGERKGPAARSTRVLVDRETYRRQTQDFILCEQNLPIIEGEGAEILTEHGRVSGLRLVDGRELKAGSLVLAGGTFGNGRIYRGRWSTPAGRRGEAPAASLTNSLKSLGHEVNRFATCTAPRLRAETVRLDDLEEQPGQSSVRPFSTLNDAPRNSQSCFLTWTNPRAHQVVVESLKDSIFYQGPGSVGAPPRYCPSIEDKISHYPDRSRHQIFLEPDGEGVIFPSGIPTGLAEDAQLAFLREVAGLEKVELAWPGYAIEYDYADPCQLAPTFESLLVPGLFLAGQMNGTSGYEEAAAQGLLAGLNAALKASGKDGVVLARSQALSGVLADDLTGKGVSEPYRLFTSRAEWRLLLREDNADLRLGKLAESLGLLSSEQLKRLRRKRDDMARGHEILSETRLTPAQSRDLGLEALILTEAVSLATLLKRPAASLALFYPFAPGLAELDPLALDSLEIEVKFEGYLRRQEEEVARLARSEGRRFPADFDFLSLSGLSTEVREVLARHRPATLGQAGRLSGVTPAALTVLAIHLKSLGID